MEDIRLRIEGYGASGGGGGGSSRYIYFYGATFTVNYSITGTAYTVTATSNTQDVTVSPATQDIMAGEDATVTINVDDITDYEVTDNGTDVTSLLVRHQIPSGGTVSQAPASYTTSGSISGTRYQSTVGCTVDSPSSQTGNDYCQSNGSTATIYYHFDFSDIPSNATISSMTVQARGHLESTSQSSEVARLNTYSGTTEKGTQVSYTSTTDATLTIAPGT